MNRLKYLFFYSLLIFSLFSCWKKDLNEFKNINEVSYQPEVAVPLLNAELTVLDSLPLNLPQFTLSDTATIEMPDTSGISDDGIVIYADFKGYTENSFPVTGDMQVYFADENNVFIDSLLSSSERFVNAGTPTNPAINNVEVHIDRAKYNHLIKAKRMYLLFRLNTRNGGNGFAPFSFNIHLGMKAKFRADLKK